MKKRFLFPLVAVAGLSGIAALGAIVGPSEEMIADNKTAIDRCIELKGDTGACDRIKTTRAYVPNGYQPTIDIALGLRKDALKQAKAEAEKQAAARKERKAAADAKIAEAKAQADAKFEAEGWFQLEPGIYGRWCTKTCSTAEVIGNQSYWLMEVWAKDRAAGDVYAQINIMRDGVIIGWTNDTAYIGRGQRAVLTFGKYGLNNPGQHQAQLVKFNARG